MATKIFSLVAIFFVSAAVQAQPMVLSSIKPLRLIAQEIVGKNADLDTLLPAAASPHDYPLKVSDYTRLRKADIVLWVGPELEGFLRKPIANLPRERVITAYDLPDLHWPRETHGAEQEHHHERDPHLWLDPRNAVIVARALEAQLVRIDSDNKTIYSQNLAKFALKMAELDKRLAVALAPVAGRGFAVYHEGYRHFVDHYGLRQLDYVTFTPEQRPGAKHLQQLRDVLLKEGKCLFLEPYSDQQAMADLAQELKLKTGTLDALGSEAGTEHYAELLQLMADAFVACLTK